MKPHEDIKEEEEEGEERKYIFIYIHITSYLKPDSSSIHMSTVAFSSLQEEPLFGSSSW